MKIAFISYWSCPLTKIGVRSGGGMSVFLLNLANQLGRLGNEVDIYTRAHRESDEVVIKIHNNVRIIHLKQTKKDLYQDIIIYAEKLLKYITQNKLSYNYIHAHYYFSGLVGQLLKNKLKIPFFATFHSLAIPKEVYAGIKDPKRIKAEKQIIDNCDGVIASTDVEKKDLISLYQAHQRKIHVVTPGVNHDLFKLRNQKVSKTKLGLPQDKKIVLFVGRIDPIKNISVLIEALSLLHDHYADFKHQVLNIIIGGDITSSDFWKQREVIKINRLIEEKNIGCCVKFIGSKPVSQLPYYYSAADLVVLPSIYESFGLAILEAMACGKAVVASKVGGLRYLVTDKENGRLFESGDANQLRKIIWDLLKDGNERLKLGRNAYAYSLRFSWEKQAKKILTIYNQYL